MKKSHSVKTKKKNLNKIAVLTRAKILYLTKLYFIWLTSRPMKM